MSSIVSGPAASITDVCLGLGNNTRWRLTETTSIKVHFADQNSLWLRGINEETNGLLRQHMPKSKDFSGFAQE